MVNKYFILSTNIQIIETKHSLHLAYYLTYAMLFIRWW